MGTVFEILGWEEFTKRCQNVADKWDDKKKSLLQKMAKGCLEEITPLIPVDTSNLVSKFQIGVITPDYAEVGTNVEYALYVNDGHVQHRRFLPISYLSAGGRKKYVHTSGKKGEKVRGNNVKRALYPRCVFSGEWYASGYSQNEKAGGEFYVADWKRDRRLWNVKLKVKRTRFLKIQELSLFFSKRGGEIVD